MLASVPLVKMDGSTSTNMTMQAKILRVISCATDPLKVVGFYSENTHVDTPLTTKQRQPIAAAAVAA